MKAQDSGNVAVLAEKPSVARDVARVLGATQSGQGFMHGNGYVVTWAIGHLVALPQPHEINPSWKQWRRNTLPMLPREWPLKVYDQTRDQFEVVRKILSSPRITSVICATDAGREGELIFRYIYEAAKCEKPVQRLWISSLTAEAIKKGFQALKPGADYDALADAARGRSQADWLVGMNLSRAYSLAYDENLSVGRVQTPTLAMVVERELTIRNFVPEDYIEVVATFHPSGHADESKYAGTWFRAEGNQRVTRLPAEGEEAKAIVDRARKGAAAIESVDNETQRMLPPLLYDLTELQRHANRLFGFSAQKTLDLAQALYERHKLISYPRTDSRHLSKDVAATLPRIVKTIEAPYRELLAPGTGERPLGRRFIDDAKVTDHHALIPTTTPGDRAGVNEDERKIYDLICRRLLSAWGDDHLSSVTTVITAIACESVVDRYYTSGTVVQQLGWKALDRPSEKKGKGRAKKDDDGDDEQADSALPTDLATGQAQDVLDAKAKRKTTKPPKRLTEGTLLTAMETAGKTLDEKELSDAMKESGLGTPATRAAIIEVLLKRGYIERLGKALGATNKGIRLIEVVHPEVKSPVMTGQWESYLQRIQKGSAQLTPFLEGIEEYVREVVGRVGQDGQQAFADARSPEPLPHGRGSETNAGTAQPKPAPSHDRQGVVPDVVTGSRSPIVAQPGESAEDLLHRIFGFPSFRANQETVCQAVIDGRDALLVMPTGAGKSLCYQLPGIARGGTTLVVSPLIALMDDQAAKLSALGFSVARIHSGLNRMQSRQACIDYLSGRLQFLFIAPERLRVTGFPEMLAKRKPSLIAIDEAHCISQWGHDFRPDYRKLSQYLPALRPAPVIALTATATPTVQHDIVEQLGLAAPALFIHGFRRDNLAIEVVEVPPSRRTELVSELLSDAERRPAIIYAPTRKHAEALARDLSALFPVAEYHAGLDPARRERVQHGFLDGKLEAVVATIAFGMGIDKPNIRTVIHVALPASLEAYYQEIGRAGRDGQPSRTILMHSYADRYTHDFFFERDYPDVAVLDKIYKLLGDEPQPKDALCKKMSMDAESFDKALEKLWIHGGAVLDFAENATRGPDEWRDSYSIQFERRRAQIDLVMRYTETSQCRMSALVRHFGDHADGERACGICDFCAPEECVAQQFRAPTPAEAEAARIAVNALRNAPPRATGKLYGQLFPDEKVTRDEFEEVLAALARAGLVHITDAVFEKDGKTIPFRRASLSRDGQDLTEDAEIDFTLKEILTPARRKRKTAAKAKKSTAAKGAKASRVEEKPVAANPALEEKLRAWRLAEAKKHGVPAFRILKDQSLRAIAAKPPAKPDDLLAVPGVGASIVKKYGAAICKICAQGQ
ncbi:MAG: DNA topoisomerase 3 [Bryobacteraceae bacterium]|nr:DNA topoisomerase 3 [Bryobacteraceae bacterium]